MSNMNNNCIMKLNKVEKVEPEIKRYMRAGKRVVIMPVTEKPKMTREEFKAWRSDRFGGTQSRWRNGTLKKTPVSGSAFGPASPAPVNKTVIVKPKRVAQTPERYGFAPKHVREMI